MDLTRRYCGIKCSCSLLQEESRNNAYPLKNSTAANWQSVDGKRRPGITSDMLPTSPQTLVSMGTSSLAYFFFVNTGGRRFASYQFAFFWGTTGFSICMVVNPSSFRLLYMSDIPAVWSISWWNALSPRIGGIISVSRTCIVSACVSSPSSDSTIMLTAVTSTHVRAFLQLRTSSSGHLISHRESNLCPYDEHPVRAALERFWHRSRRILQPSLSDLFHRSGIVEADD